MLGIMKINHITTLIHNALQIQADMHINTMLSEMPKADSNKRIKKRKTKKKDVQREKFEKSEATVV